MLTADGWKASMAYIHRTRLGNNLFEAHDNLYRFASFQLRF